MDFVFESMSDKEARKIAAWKYEPPYAFYDMAKDPEDLEELLAPDKRKDYFSATSDGVLVGYFCFGRDARVSGGDYSGEAVDVGLGMRPDLTGKGLGLSFLESGLGFARERFSPTRFRLSVAAVQRAGDQSLRAGGLREVREVHPKDERRGTSLRPHDAPGVVRREAPRSPASPLGLKVRLHCAENRLSGECSKMARSYIVMAKEAGCGFEDE